MDKSSPDWNLYRSFLAVVNEGSLSGAARRLGLTQPSLGRHIRELELSLGVALFTRSPQGLIPTDTALTLQPHAEAMASASAALQRAASCNQESLSGVVRVSASDVVGAELLPSILASFRERHPDIAIELVLSNQTTDLLRKDADLAVRMVRPTQQALIAKRVGNFPLGFYAHRDYIDIHGEPSEQSELVRHSLIGFDHEPPYVRQRRPASVPYSREHFSLRTDNDLAALAALRAGFGIGLCQVGIAQRNPELVRVLTEMPLPALEAWLVMHEDLRSSAPVRLLFDHLATELRRYSADSLPGD